MPNNISIVPVTTWEEKFNKFQGREKELQNYNNWSKWNDSYWYYFLGNAIDGFTAMYEATGKMVYLDQALSYIQSVIDDAEISASFPKSQYRDNFLGWICRLTDIRNPTTDEKNCLDKEIPLYESYMCRYVTKVLRLIWQAQDPYIQQKYKNQYETILAFTEFHIFKKWYDRGLSNLERSRTHMYSHWAYVALDLFLITRDEARKTMYRDVIDKFDIKMRNQIEPNPIDNSAYFWDATWSSFARPGQDTSHGNHVISYMIEAHEHNPQQFWSQEDIAKLINLSKNVLWDRSKADFKDFFDGTYATGTHTGNLQSDGFIKLGRYDASLQQIYQAYEKQKNYLIQYYGNGALNAKFLIGNFQTS